jgi:hypothetical protein
MIYLYLKTHNTTSLKYLGKTESKNPHKYKGSGKYWKSHIKKHGYNVTTQILLVTEDKEELRETGLFFSRLWDVVKSDEFANCRDESGDGITSEYSKAIQKKRRENGDRRGLFTKEIALEHNAKMMADGTHPSQNPEIIKRTNSKMLEDGTHPFQDKIKMLHNRSVVKAYQLNAVAEGNHNFKGRVVCRDKFGVKHILSKDEYDSGKIGTIENWKYVPVTSRESKKRKELCNA